MDIADIDLSLPLHYTNECHPNPAAIKLQVRHHPPALLAKTKAGVTPNERKLVATEVWVV